MRVRDRVDLIVIDVGKDVHELRRRVDLAQHFLSEDRAVLHLEHDRQVVRAAERLRPLVVCRDERMAIGK